MRLLILSLLLALAAGAARAECYADFKAKRDDPLRLMYGVSEVTGADCSTGAAAQQLQPVLAADGWELLEVVGTFGADGLNEREEDAGEYFLRY
ncbi:hypothetical protein [Wenxinia saemankumensis]|uniref:DUF4177 domain-containing protein n=1 Tax=Wenxinia saemankumensis TaxID=1447782 RepID=A0A1M6FKC5_9RHOB|nr:hypothetical protein [Wenxinia saemankumensis]SHI98116.1 hypothetical protein SAMN05444417_2365 [Wenxinia saemankumensis]